MTIWGRGELKSPHFPRTRINSSGFTQACPSFIVPAGKTKPGHCLESVNVSISHQVSATQAHWCSLYRTKETLTPALCLLWCPSQAALLALGSSSCSEVPSLTCHSAIKMISAIRAESVAGNEE